MKQSTAPENDRTRGINQSCAAKRTTQSRTSGPRVPEASREAKRIAASILEVLAGANSPASAATALAISLPRYYLLEQRAIEGLVTACEPRSGGRTLSPQRELDVPQEFDTETLAQVLAALYQGRFESFPVQADGRFFRCAVRWSARRCVRS